MWVAANGGYVVKYVLTTSHDPDYFGEGVEGELSWDYELTNVNQPVTMELPADCPAGMLAGRSTTARRHRRAEDATAS